jgi:hypothetical protein
MSVIYQAVVGTGYHAKTVRCPEVSGVVSFVHINKGNALLEFGERNVKICFVAAADRGEGS